MTGKNINTGYIYYAKSYRRQPVEISTDLRNQAIVTISDVLKLWEAGIIPLANYSPRCRGCSLFSQCLPLANERVNKYREEV